MVIAVVPSFNSLGIVSRNVASICGQGPCQVQPPSTCLSKVWPLPLSGLATPYRLGKVWLLPCGREALPTPVTLGWLSGAWLLPGDHRDMLLGTSFCSILDSSVGLSANIQSAGDSVPKTLVRILHPTEEDNLSPFDSEITCLCQSIEINNNIKKKHVYHQSQVRKPTGSGVEWAACSLVIGTGY